MFQGKRIGALLLMGGEGRRFGMALPKQFHLLGGKKVYSHALDTLLAAQLFDRVVLVCHPSWTDLVCGEVAIVKGGATRQQSSYQGLIALKKEVDIILIHDAVRPFVTEQILRDNVAGAIQWGAVNTCIPSTDTLVHAPDGGVIASIPKRGEFFRGQTPQTFQMDWILEGHEKALEARISDASDDCQLVARLGRAVRLIAGSEKNLKITSHLDLLLAEQLVPHLKNFQGI